ncbi:MAG TPA: DNA polymerase/3'-5' exonuclease PolX [Anaerolineae bacterium]|nr:DNA polymerase/3'-5' exonuclease PolX [Anaerolineae bacterium]
MNNRDIAQTFEQIADMLAIRGDHFHKVLAYRRAAENIRELDRDLGRLRDEGDLTDIPGIGAALSDKIEEMLDTGRLDYYERLAAEVPPSLVEMLQVEGLGPKRVRQIHESLAITTMEELAQVAGEGQLRSLPGLGVKSEAKLVASIQALSRRETGRTPLGTAWPIAQEILAELRTLPGVSASAVAGSLRRMRETIGDVDLLVAAEDAGPVMAYFCSMPRVESVLGSGPTKSSVILVNGLQVDLRVLPAERWGTLLSYFTGSKYHNVKLRQMALAMGLSLNEHSFTPQDGGHEILCRTEEEVYDVLGLPFIPPTLREDKGEIEAAQQGELPDLIYESSIVADLHLHSTWSDGRMSILEMARANEARGYKHIVIADHSVSLGIANGLSVERLRQQADEIRVANEAMGSDFTILHGTEMEIKADGSLDYPDDVLAELDFVIASLHVGLRQPRKQVMSRILTAINNPHVDMIGHPTGRLIPDRAAADLDMEEVLQAAAASQTIIEINANPQRLDLRDIHVRRAIELGVKLAINTDAHHSDQLAFMYYGLAMAQRGWATADDVVNTWPVERLLAYVDGGSEQW